MTEGLMQADWLIKATVLQLNKTNTSELKNKNEQKKSVRRYGEQYCSGMHGASIPLLRYVPYTVAKKWTLCHLSHNPTVKIRDLSVLFPL